MTKKTKEQTLRDQLEELSRGLEALVKRAEDRSEAIRQAKFSYPGPIAVLEREAAEDERLAQRLKKRLSKIGETLSEATKTVEDFLRMIFTLSTGALALTVTFQSSLAPEGVTQVGYLKLAWLGFVVAIVTYTFRKIPALFSQFEMWPRTFWKWVDYTCPGISVLGFIQGCLWFFLFALSNLPRSG
jgi:hypothetical protein